jgi:transcriptional regulator with XRE-family HTH domain
MTRAKRDEGCIRFGRRLVSVRLGLALTQEAVSADCGMSQRYLSGVENGWRNLGLKNIFRLADAMGVMPLVLMDVDGVTDVDVSHIGEQPAAYVAKRPAPSRRGSFLAAEGRDGDPGRLPTARVKRGEPLETDSSAGKTPSLEPSDAARRRLARRVATLFPGGIPRRIDRGAMRLAILNLLDGKFVNINDLAAALSRVPESIRGDYLRPLVAEGVVALRYPDNPSHPQQAYKATAKPAPPR